MLETIEWTPQGVVMIDQTLLPTQTVFVTCKDYLEVAHAIKTMIIRGAPAIGIAAAMGVAIGVQKAADPDAEFATICDTLAATRPTASRRVRGTSTNSRASLSSFFPRCTSSSAVGSLHGATRRTG